MIRPKISHGSLLVAAVAFSIFFTWFPLTNTDIWWHLSAGREMLAQKTFLRTDPFSFTLDHSSWINCHWLFQVIAYALYSIAGVNALLMFKALCVGVTLFLLCTAHSSRPATVFSCVVLPLLLFEARYLVLVRPVLATLVFISAMIFLMEQYLRTRRMVYLWLSLPVQAFWVNFQSLHILGWFIFGAYWIGIIVESVRLKNIQIIKIPSIIFFCLLFASFINPYGLDALVLPFRLFARISPMASDLFSYNISENIPLFSLPPHERHYLYAVLIVSLAGFASFGLRKNPVSIAHLLLLVGFVILAIQAKRNVLLFFVVAVPVIATNISDFSENNHRKWTPYPQKTGSRRIIIFGMAGIYTICFVLQCSVMRHFPKSAISPFRIPVAAVQYLEQHPIPGNLFNAVRHGGYLIWRRYPSSRVFIDGRLILRSPEFFAEYLALCDHPELFPKIKEKHNITHVLLPSAVISRYRCLIQWLNQSRQWQCLFSDGDVILFAREDIAGSTMDLHDKEVVGKITSRIREKWRNNLLVRELAIGYFQDLLDLLETEQVAH